MTENCKWNVESENFFFFSELRSAIRSVLPLAASGSDIIALGEVWNALDCIEDDPEHEIEYIVSLSVGFRIGDKGFEEGRFMSIGISDEFGIVLDELNTNYSPDVGSDHFTVPYTRMNRELSFDAVDFTRWMEGLRETLLTEGVALQTSRNHV